MRKPAFCICENKDADQLRGNSAFVFAIRREQSLYFLNLKFIVSNNLLWLYSPVCVRRDENPGRLVFSQRGSYHCLSNAQEQPSCDALSKIHILNIYLGS